MKRFVSAFFLIITPIIGMEEKNAAFFNLLPVEMKVHLLGYITPTLEKEKEILESQSKTHTKYFDFCKAINTFLENTFEERNQLKKLRLINKELHNLVQEQVTDLNILFKNLSKKIQYQLYHTCFSNHSNDSGGLNSSIDEKTGRINSIWTIPKISSGSKFLILNLPPLLTLQSLNLYCLNGLKEGDLERFSQKFPNLTHLNLRSTDITDNGLRSLIELKKIISLNLSQNTISLNGIRIITPLKNNLKEITLYNTHIKSAADVQKILGPIKIHIEHYKWA